MRRLFMVLSLVALSACSDTTLTVNVANKISEPYCEKLGSELVRLQVEKFVKFYKLHFICSNGEGIVVEVLGEEKE